MSRADDLEAERQIADLQTIMAKTMRPSADPPDDPPRDPDVAPGEVSRVALGGFGDGYEPPRGAWRARWLRRRTPVLVFVAVAVATAVATAAVAWFLRPAATPVPPAPASVAAADEKSDAEPVPGAAGTADQTGGGPAPSTSAAATIVVAVVGAVTTPGLYTLPQGARVSDALAAAGGALPGTDLTSINIARKLTDGEQVAVGVPGAPPATAPDPGGGAAAPTGPVDLNSATLEQLDGLPGIGPVLAQRIIDFRTDNGPFAAVDELTQVSGVGPSIMAKIKDRVTV
ncbi:ComEA family DNA-binding protein [Cumulibacter manganitolerans]|uniref:ComEA family DNA-binding protein n=1 Tax=Cumulibacter manganitolerans TaxID=1884992 RepID=UPI001295FB4E|nr:ComEA family DNA-binding protein [Cumulibacter manganitolerans]